VHGVAPDRDLSLADARAQPAVKANFISFDLIFINFDVI
jgi:hypothetical protein